jgi:hypothetical protein
MLAVSRALVLFLGCSWSLLSTNQLAAPAYQIEYLDSVAITAALVRVAPFRLKSLSKG